MAPRLYFLRHGQAENRQDWHGDDAKRPLTAQGKKRMLRATGGIRKLGLSLDAIISSPLVRAFQTAEIVAEGLGGSARLLRDDRLSPGFGPAHLRAIVEEHGSAGALMLVGHEPDFSETIGHLTGAERLAVKKGALAYVQLDESASLQGTLVWLIPAKALER